MSEDKDEQGYNITPEPQNRGKDTYRKTQPKNTGANKLTVQLARFEERLENLISANREAHKQILDAQADLCKHVNHEVEAMDQRLKDVELHGTTPLREVTDKLVNLVDKIESRVCTLERFDLAETSKYKGRMELFQWTSIVLGVVISTVTVLHFFGLF